MRPHRRPIQSSGLPVGTLLLVVVGLAIGCTGTNHPERVAKTTTGSVRAKLSGVEQKRDDLVQFRARTPIDVIVESFAGARSARKARNARDAWNARNARGARNA